MSRVAVIIGAGPAGLTAAYELLEKTDIVPLIIERDHMVGGISRTVDYKGNKFDIGGHRFFSKSDRVMSWWQNILPIQGTPEGAASTTITYQQKTTTVAMRPGGPDPETTDKVMLVRSRKSRIFFLRKFFDYPISLSPGSLFKLGLWRSVRMTFSYIYAQLFPMKPEKSLREFFINRFGKVLYLTFFKSYTEKVWGVPCNKIPSEWGAQRVKSLSLGRAVWNQIRGILMPKSATKKNTPTSLIERFLYPKFGPGQMWEEVARIVRSKGGEIRFGWEPVRIETSGGSVTAVEVRNLATGETQKIACDYFFSTMPVKELLPCFSPEAPASVRDVASRLVYRDMVVAGLLLRRMNVVGDSGRLKRPPDNWIYIQERDVKVGRLQIFNNWSPYLVRDPETVWVGMEYFCDEGDEIWMKSDAEMTRFAADELAKMKMIKPEDVMDSKVLHVKKTYPAYLEGYKDFQVVRDYVDGFANLFLIGRNGMHRYNNQDHSMLTAMVAVENIIKGVRTKENIWSINTDDEYHEEKAENI
jgi:protoporphyrinogen oxidase